MGAFNEGELAYLKLQPKFQNGLAKIITTDDFESLCVIGEDLLAAREISKRTTNPSGFGRAMRSP